MINGTEEEIVQYIACLKRKKEGAPEPIREWKSILVAIVSAK